MSVLVDTSVWVHHFRRANKVLVDLVVVDEALTHPMVIGELACGTPPSRDRTLQDMALLTSVRPASHEEVLRFVETEKLYGLGCGLVDMSLLASTLLTPGAKLWTLDKKLGVLCERFAIAFAPAIH
ncbi:MAG TPA: type II toxin-antitoxin system VapC family toxin [Ramlibacter sp.]|uniref:type II toxin-antitoxin system VapC family toxin n=1 Tax=Ramlibacter sp. TaxID=1917967 RepID=UPI002BFE8609|nr:type II toxin-antitoxin system VapC family toxin [Ramlibacter sp.]HVZ46437.1 type II toxin-antitoxin system VapC family toxin [Ramlibacter sp.]